MYAGVYLSPAPALSLTWILSIASFHRLRAPLKSDATFLFQALHISAATYAAVTPAFTGTKEGDGRKKNRPSRLGASLIKQRNVQL